MWERRDKEDNGEEDAGEVNRWKGIGSTLLPLLREIIRDTQ